MSIGIPVKVIHEAEGHVVTVELKSGEMYRGKLVEAEDNMNCRMSDITFTARDGRVSQLDAIYLRGSKIRFVVLPDMLKNAPMFKRDPKAARGRGIGRGNRGVFRGGRGTRRGAPGSRGPGPVGGGRPGMPPQAPRFPITK